MAPDQEMLQYCPEAMASDAKDTKGATLLENHGEAALNYHVCKKNHAGLVDWAKSVIRRCAEASQRNEEAQRNKSWWQLWR